MRNTKKTCWGYTLDPAFLLDDVQLRQEAVRAALVWIRAAGWVSRRRTMDGRCVLTTASDSGRPGRRIEIKGREQWGGAGPFRFVFFFSSEISKSNSPVQRGESILTPDSTVPAMRDYRESVGASEGGGGNGQRQASLFLGLRVLGWQPSASIHLPSHLLR